MPKTKRQIAFLVLGRFEQLDLTGPCEVFARSDREGAPAYETHILSAAKDLAVVTSNGLSIGPSKYFANFKKPLDTLLIIGRKSSRASANAKVKEWQRCRSKRTRRVGSISSGVFPLAEAGLLNGRRATTHWQLSSALEKRFPKVRVEHDPIFIKDGHIYTAAGGSAGIDLALALVEEDLGFHAAMGVARSLVLFLRRPGGQAQFSSLLEDQVVFADQAFRNLPAWVCTNLTRDLSVRSLAKASSMSERTFARRFSEVFNMTPGAWVQRRRINAARRYLETTRLGLKEIAARTGFAHVGSLQLAFRSHLHASLLEYRKKVHLNRQR